MVGQWSTVHDPPCRPLQLGFDAQLPLSSCPGPPVSQIQKLPFSASSERLMAALWALSSVYPMTLTKHFVERLDLVLVDLHSAENSAKTIFARSDRIGLLDL